MYCTIILTILYLITFYVILDHNVVSNIFQSSYEWERKAPQHTFCAIQFHSFRKEKQVQFHEAPKENVLEMNL